MYCVYQYNAGATKGNIVADVVKLLTGTTDISSLSSDTTIAVTQASVTALLGVFSGFSGLSVNAHVGKYLHHNGAQRGIITANTTTTVTIDDITYTQASSYTAYITSFNIWTSWAGAGWSVYDASAGTNAQCLRAALSDDAAQYKYAVIDTNTTGVIQIKGYESWNSGTHAGANLITPATTFLNQQVDTTSGGILYIASSARHILFMSYIGTTWGGATGNTFTAFMEHTRVMGYDTVANAYPLAGLFGHDTGVSYLRASYPRILLLNGSDGTGSNAASYFVATAFYSGNPTGTLSQLGGPTPAESDKSTRHLLLPIWTCKLAEGSVKGEVSSNCEVYFTTYNVGSALDLREYGGNKYVLFPMGTNYRFVVRRG